MSNGTSQRSLLFKHCAGPDARPLHVYIVGAHYIDALETWGMTFKRDGELVDHRQASDPWKEAQSWVSEQVQLDIE